MNPRSDLTPSWSHIFQEEILCLQTLVEGSPRSPFTNPRKTRGIGVPVRGTVKPENKLIVISGIYFSIRRSC